MKLDLPIRIPENLDWPLWMSRWDRMQEYYLARREERFATIAALIGQTQPDGGVVLDLGCGPGSLTRRILEAIPNVRVIGVDAEPALLALAEKCLGSFADRAELVFADCVDPGLWETITTPLAAVVSSTALHWIAPTNLAALYETIHGKLAPGGIFLNADHAASSMGQVHSMWQDKRYAGFASSRPEFDWRGFWAGYSEALGTDARTFQPAEGSVEDGMPLSWHFDKLRAAGFGAVDCFWRCDGDAIYGALKNPAGEGETT